jgi:protein-disulfide isomerase
MTAQSDRDFTLTPDKKTDHILGPESASVTLIEYGDLECPSCRQAQEVVAHVRQHFAQKLRFVFRHFPLREVHPHAELAAEAAEAAGAQGKFWPYVDLLFEHQSHLKEKSLFTYAEQLELDMVRFHAEMKDHVYLQRVNEHIDLGNRLALRATPTFFVNGELVDVSFGFQRLEQAIEQKLQHS